MTGTKTTSPHLVQVKRVDAALRLVPISSPPACCGANAGVTRHVFPVSGKRNYGYGMGMKSYDLIVALRLLLADASERERPTTWLANELGLSTSRIHESLGRLRTARLVDPLHNRVARKQLLEFIEHGVPYVFPAEVGAVTRGVPTATSAMPLASVFDASGPESAFVWPSALGTVRGASVVPLHKLVPEIAERDERMHELLALVDGVRLGNARIRKEALPALKERMRVPAA